MSGTSYARCSPTWSASRITTPTAPWTIPNFSVRSHHEGLGQLDDLARSEGGLVLTEGFYLLRVRAPA